MAAKHIPTSRREISMMRACACAIFVLLLSLAMTGEPAWAQEQHHDAAQALEKLLSEPMALSPKALGSFNRPISSSNAEAQAYFNQGFQLMYAFDKMGAVRSFREAAKRDPNCAACYWAEAWSWGSYLNGPMQPSDAPYAYAAIQKARQLLPGRASAVERALIEAMSVRYTENFDPAKRRDQDTAYAEAMRKVYEQFPNDLDAGTLYADALFVMEPRRGSRDINAPNIRRIAAVLESVLAKDIRHAGACHLYVHLTEATTNPEKAAPCAEYLGNAIPGASHINHMPSHTWNLVGRWGDSVRANIQAVHSDQKADIGEGFAIYPPHNLHMLLFAASMDGQSAIALQAARDYARSAGSNMFLILTLVRFGRFTEIPEITKSGGSYEDAVIEAGVWNFGQGYAALRAGDKDFARAYLSRAQEAAANTTATFRFHSAANFVGTLAGILEGEILRADGDLEKAIASFERAVASQDAMIFDEPEPLPLPARHWLGAAFLEAKRFADAERVYREDLRKHPHNGWALFGLKAALESQDKPSTEVVKDLETSWSRADTWLRGSIF
jgi:tetratricopeptide (TPR) repeat protein